MKLAGVLACLLVTAATVYPESPAPPKGAASRFTSHTNVSAGNTELPLLTEETLSAWLRSWQRRLGLDEWKIEAKIVRLSQLQKGTVANVHWSLPRRSATIKVLDPADNSLPRNEILRDTELSIVHELVHLSMARLPLDGTDTDIEEEAVKRISTALLSLDKREDDQKR